MRAFWKQDGVISIKLRDDLFSLAQMVNSVAMMRFYNIFRNKDEWTDVNLKNIPIIFTVDVGNIVIHRLGVRRVSPKEVTPGDLPCDRYFIHVGDNAEGYRLRNEFIWKGGNLVDLGEGAQIVGYQAPAIIQNLTVKDHRDIILNHSTTNMYGDKDVAERLLKFYDTGVNLDPLLPLVFPDLMA